MPNIEVDDFEDVVALEEELRNSGKLGPEQTIADGKSVIKTNNRELRDVSADCLNALRTSNQPPYLFVRSGAMVHVATDEDGRSSLAPVSVSTNAFDAGQGAAGGAFVNVVIKSGTNDLHGVFFERNTNNDFDAINNYFSHPGTLAKNIQNQFGFAIGGPVVIPKVVHGRNKLFWFMSYESTRQSQFASDPNLTLPTVAMRTGDFSATGVVVYDPLTGNADGTGRTPFPGNMVPTKRIGSASATLTSLLPNLTVCAGNTTRSTRTITMARCASIPHLVSQLIFHSQPQRSAILFSQR
jgi:hypothetical protein